MIVYFPEPVPFRKRQEEEQWFRYTQSIYIVVIMLYIQYTELNTVGRDMTGSHMWFAHQMQ
jgi:hypothetical protein